MAVGLVEVMTMSISANTVELGRVMSRAVVPWIGTSLRVDTALPTWGKIGAVRHGALEGGAIIVEGVVAASIQHGLFFGESQEGVTASPIENDGIRGNGS